MIIEFVGLSGSGKSTIARQLAQDPDFRIIKIREKGDLLRYNLAFLFRHPLRFFSLLAYVFRNSNGLKELYYKLMNCFFDYNAKSEKARSVDVAILDQGYFQNIISLFDHKINKEELVDYVAYLPKPDYLFVFDLGRKERDERLKERGYAYRADFSEAEIAAFADLAEHNYAVFLRSKQELLPDAIVIEADKDAVSLVEDLRKMINIK